MAGKSGSRLKTKKGPFIIVHDKGSTYLLGHTFRVTDSKLTTQLKGRKAKRAYVFTSYGGTVKILGGHWNEF